LRLDIVQIMSLQIPVDVDKENVNVSVITQPEIAKEGRLRNIYDA
jgi:hypothetical protein